MSPEERMDRLDALLQVQAADLGAVYSVLSTIAAQLREQHPQAPWPDVQALFLASRKLLLLSQLEQMEKFDPARAARLLQLIQESSTYYPPTYE